MHLLQTVVSPGNKPLEKRIVAKKLFRGHTPPLATSRSKEALISESPLPCAMTPTPARKNELNDSKLEKLTHRRAMTPACAMTRTITVRIPANTDVRYVIKIIIHYS